MKKFLIIFGLVLGFASAVYADGYFCCAPSLTKEKCCAERGKMYCENDGTCRTKCKCEPDECCGCVNPEGECCLWCPSMEVCEAMGKCQKIDAKGCYTCAECPVPNPCPVPQCMNEEGVCCDRCPRVCPEGECLTNVDGCYKCGTCGDDNIPNLPISD